VRTGEGIRVAFRSAEAALLSRSDLFREGRPAIDPYVWEGISPSQYTTTWDANNDYSMNSPQACVMNLVAQSRRRRSSCR
jgi:hypothetical protein